MRLNLVSNKVSNKLTSFNVERVSSYQELLEKIRSMKNTLMTLNYENKSVEINIQDATQRLAVMMLLATVKSSSNTIKNNNAIDIDKMIEDWKVEEKITLRSAFINREIDKLPLTKEKSLTNDERIEIFEEIKKIYNIKLDSKCTQTSIVQSLSFDNVITDKINSLKIDEDLKKESNINFKSILSEINAGENNNLKLSRIKGDLYYEIAKNIYGILLFDNETPLAFFNELHQKIQNLVLKAISKRSENIISPKSDN